MDDLDKLIAEPHEVTVGKWEALGRGAAQGATLGFGDEAAGVWNYITKAPADALMGQAPSAGSYYIPARDAVRAANARAEAAHPNYYLGGNIAGGAAPASLATLLTGGAAWSGLPIALGEGGLGGLGTSDAETFGGLARDTGAGIGLGALGYGGGALIRKGFSGLASKAGEKTAAAAARAEAQAAEEIAQEGAGLSGQLGGETQKGSRTMEFFQRFHDLMSPEQQAAFRQKMLESGEGQRLIQGIADNYLESGPRQLEAIAQKRAALDAFNAGREQAILARTAALRKPQFGKDAASFAKSYAEPVAAMTLASALGMGPAGEAAAGVMFGRTRAGKALMSRINRPGNSEAVWNLIHGVADSASSPGTLGTVFRRGLTGAAVVPSAAAAATRMDDHDALVALLRSQGMDVVTIPTPKVGEHPAQDDLDRLMNEGSP